MSETPFKRLILRAVLRDVYPMVIRLVAVPDYLELNDFDDVFHAVLGWDGGIGYTFQVQGQEFNSFRRRTRAKRLRDFAFHRQEKFLYVLDSIDQWEWEVRVIDQQPGAAEDETPVCVGGRGATPPQYSGGPTGYRLMLKRQEMGDKMFPPAEVETVIGMLTSAHPDGPASTWEVLRDVIAKSGASLDRRLEESGPLTPGRFSLLEANERFGETAAVPEVRVKLRLEVVWESEGEEQRRNVMAIERSQLAMETLGLNLGESKTLLDGVQDIVVAQQVAENLEQRRRCSHCGERYGSKGGGTKEVKTLFGRVKVANPRWNRCRCQPSGAKTFRPTLSWLQGQTSPELLYLETKWASLIPFGKVADLLREVLPLDDGTNHETIRRHLHETAERMEKELGAERQLRLFEEEVAQQEDPAPPDGPITVGIDGGYVRAAHKEGFFEVIAGRSVVAFRREAKDEVPEAKCFGYVQTYDEKPRRRLWELMKSQGLQDHQQVVFMSDGGEDVRRVQEYMQPGSEHWIDWFHITMRVTVLQQQTKSLMAEAGRADTGAAIAKRIDSVKHLIWHGNVAEALDRLHDLLDDLDLIRAHSAAAEKLACGMTEFEIYIRNNRQFIPNFGERYRQGETITTAFVESTINQVVSRRFVKKQQMTWTLRGAHLLLQTRTKVLNNELENVFRSWYPQFRPSAKAA